MFVPNKDVRDAAALDEIIVSMVIAIYSSHIIFDDSNLEILLTGRIPFANIVFNRYFMYISMILLLGALQYAMSLAFVPQYAFCVFASLIFATLVLSGISLVTAVISKSTGVSTVVTVTVIGFMLGIQNPLKKHLMPEWLHYINPYETTFFYGMKYWLQNRVILFGIAVVAWILSYALLRSRKFEYRKL
jgi:hypothetical protein